MAMIPWSKSKTGNVFYNGQKVPSSWWDLYAKTGTEPPAGGGSTSTRTSKNPAAPTTPTTPAPSTPSQPKVTPASNKWSDIVSAYFPKQMKSGGLVRGNGCAKKGRTKGKMR